MSDVRPLLLVEDDHLDAMTVMRVLKDLNTPNPIIHVWNGEEALAYLKTADRPCTILLDLNMPSMDGFDFLEALSGDPALEAIPVIVMTTSEDQADMTRCRAYGTVDYVLKCFGYEVFKEKLSQVAHHWRCSSLDGAHL